MKKYLFIALAAFAFAACEKPADENNPQQNGELEKSYVAITLASDDMNTRADDGKYEEGLDVERAVKSAYVFFFKDGAAFPVSFDGNTSTNAGPLNYIEVELTGNQTNMDNVSDVKDAVLVLQNYNGEYPNQIVAVLNWEPANQLYDLDVLRDVVCTLGNDTNGYVMSNAVYADKNNDVVDAVALTADNIAKDAETAKKNPVKIYVERVAAKVVFSSDKGGKFEIATVNDTVDNTETTVYAQIKGFELYNDYQTSYLIKNINPAWNDLGFNWNDPDWFRSYWATSLIAAFPNNHFDWNNNNTPMEGYVYCGENTRAWTKDADVRTKVIIKAQLVDNAGNPVEVVNWYGKEYVGEGNLLKVVANTLKNTYFFKNGNEYVGLTPADIKCVGRNPQDTNAFEVFFAISDNSKTKTWYKNLNGDYKEIELEVINKELAEVQPALVYNEGMTYYWLDIKHLGAEGKTAEYGVVRNHVYKVNIADIDGYGTPVYDGLTDFITPEQPKDINSFVAAQINILSWRVVEGNYNVK